MGVKPKSIKFVNQPNVWASTTTGTIYEFTDTQYSRTKPHEKRFGNKKIVSWGKNNLMPYYNRQLIADSDTKQQLINTDVDLACGKGLVFYREVDKDGDGLRDIEYVINQQLEDWRDEWMLEEFFSETMQDLKEFGNSWCEFILSRDKSRVNSLFSLDAVDCRLEVPKTGKFSKNVFLADWKYHSLREDMIATVPLLNKRMTDLGKGPTKVAAHLKLHYSGQPFYSLTEWYGSKTWTEVSTFIPKFHLSGLKGGYTLRYHIKIPISYLEERVAALKANGKTEADAVKAVKAQIQEELDAVLSGAENAQKAFTSWVNDRVPNPVEWKIEKIETDLKDDSYIALSDAADKKHARGHNMHPVLAGIETSGSLSSGSEILNLVNFHTAYKTPRYRRAALRPIQAVMKMNFPDLWAQGYRIGVEDVKLTTLDKNPTGTQNGIQNG